MPTTHTLPVGLHVGRIFGDLGSRTAVTFNFSFQ